MATLADAQTPNVEGTSVPRGLATAAVARCRDLMRALLRQIVIVGGPGTRASAYGLYELMHAIGDSFSGAHSARRDADRGIEYLRVWKPLEKIARLPLERSAGIPASVFHTWNDQRDKEYVVDDRVVFPNREEKGRKCQDLTDHPYEVPFECLSAHGEQARLALVELLVIVRDLRLERLASGGDGSQSFPERSAAWRSYEEKWFSPVYLCRDDECAAKQPADLLPGAYRSLGLGFSYNGSRRFFDATARGALLRYSWDLNPFIYQVQGDVGYRRFHDGAESGIAGLSLDLLLPIGKRASLGFTPGEFRAAFGGSSSGSDLTSRFFRFDYRMSDRLFVTLTGPLEVNWRRPAVEWGFGVGLVWAPGTSQSADGPLLQAHSETAKRHDDAWVPAPAPYGFLLGRRPSWFLGVGSTTVEKPAQAVEDRIYGLGIVSGEVMWDRSRWGGRFEWAPSVSLGIGARRTSGESSYLTGVLGIGARWYVLRILGLSLTAVRLEGGPKIRGEEEADPSPGVHGDAGSQHYFLAGSRLGIVFTAGLVDLLVEAPTIGWTSKPFETREILSVRLAIRLN
jgi:hypothetical protein